MIHTLAGLGDLHPLDLHFALKLSFNGGINLSYYVGLLRLTKRLEVGTRCRRFPLDVIIEIYAILSPLAALPGVEFRTALAVLCSLPYPFFACLCLR